jgi:uncharacterized repeat protein (TIGR01451 family)
MPKSIASRALVLALALGFAPLAASAQPAFQVKDLGTTIDTQAAFGGLAQLGGIAFFSVNDQVHGYELWRSDGTPGGTFLLADLCPGLCSSFANGTAFGGLFYFSASNGEDGLLYRTDGTTAGTLPVFPLFSPLGQKHLRPFSTLGSRLLLLSDNPVLGTVELWTSDGTAGGTSLVKSLGPIPAFDGPLPMAHVGAGLLFSFDDGIHGREPWRTDGTPAGTGLVADLNPGSEGSISAPLGGAAAELPVVAGAMLFNACDLLHGCEPWKSDGTAAGTALVKELSPSVSSSGPRSFALWNGVAVFFATDNSSNPSQPGLFKSDGTDAGTVRIAPPQGSSFLEVGELAVAGPTIFFTACSTPSGCQLWKSDGTPAGTSAVKTLGPHVNSSGLGNGAGLTAVGNRVVFYDDDGTHGFEPWGSDGTPAGTALLADANPGAGSAFPYPYQVPVTFAGPGFWLIPAYAPAGWEVLGSDGTPAGTASLAQVQTQTPSLPEFFSYRDGFFDVFGKALFFAGDGSAFVGSLFASDGTDAGTTALAGNQTLGHQVARLGGNAYYDGPSNQVWRSDGTAAGTAVFWNGGGSRWISGFAVAGTELYFTSTVFNDIQLWKSDGTPGGTSQVRDIPSPGPISAPPRVYAAGNLVFLPTGSPAGDLWVSDGTDAGTGPVTLPGQTASFFSPTLFTPAGNRLFFAGHGTELWVSDGTGAGTALLHTFSSLAGAAVAAGSRLFFLADDGVHGSELWTSDGTAAGTHLVADIFPGAIGAFPRSIGVLPYPMAVLFGRVYFAADDGVHGQELWASDGTAAGTQLVADLLPGAGSSLPSHLVAIGHLLFFAATDGDHSVEPWRSDGTAAGTKMIQDVAPGALPSSPDGFAAAGPYLYFAANDGTHGYEPWALPRASLGGFLTATLTVAGQTQEGGTVTYTLTVTNIGAGPVLDNLGDEVADVLPASFTLLSATAGSGAVTLDLPGNRVAWNGALDPGASVTITIQARVGAGTFGTPLANQATLAFDADGNGSNESSGVSDDPGRPGAADATTFSPATAALGFYILPPCRAVDTRGGTPLAGGAARTVALAGTCGIPAGARAIAGNFTVVNPTAPGFLTVFPTGTPAPLASTLNFSRGQTRTNNAVFALSGGKLDAKAGLLGGGQADLVLDVVGYFQ